MTELVTGGISAEPVTNAEPRRDQTVRRLLNHRTFVIGSLSLVIIVLIALAAPLLAPHDPMT